MTITKYSLIEKEKHNPFISVWYLGKCEWAASLARASFNVCVSYLLHRYILFPYTLSFPHSGFNKILLNRMGNIVTIPDTPLFSLHVVENSSASERKNIKGQQTCSERDNTSGEKQIRGVNLGGISEAQSKLVRTVYSSTPVLQWLGWWWYCWWWHAASQTIPYIAIMVVPTRSTFGTMQCTYWYLILISSVGGGSRIVEVLAVMMSLVSTFVHELIAIVVARENPSANTFIATHKQPQFNDLNSQKKFRLLSCSFVCPSWLFFYFYNEKSFDIASA